MWVRLIPPSIGGRPVAVGRKVRADGGEVVMRRLANIDPADRYVRCRCCFLIESYNNFHR
jgi:hypothetical protein